MTHIASRLAVVATTLGVLTILSAPAALADAKSYGSSSGSSSSGGSSSGGSNSGGATASGRTASAGAFTSFGPAAQVIGADRSWAAGGTGRGVDVAVIDTGVSPVGDLGERGRLVYGPDLSFDSQDPSRIHLDGYGHGTAMAGIVAGVAPGARVVSVKVGSSTGATDVSQLIAAIDWVVEHAQDPGMNIRVLNLSLGTSGTQSYVLDPVAHAAEVAWRHGIVVVVAAGNDGTANMEVATPATDPYVLTVGASDSKGTVGTADDVVPEYSSRGTGRRSPDVVAPGSHIVSPLVPGSYLARTYPNAVLDSESFRGSGTSQAAAMVSGAVADLLSLRPRLTPDQVKALFMSTARPIAARNPNFAGKGLIDIPAAAGAAVPRNAVQTYPVSTGTGSLEASRGDNHVFLNGVALTGEQDILGSAWQPGVLAAQEEATDAWSGGTWNGATWSGSTWSGATWSGFTWSGATWSGATWSGATWSGATWSGATWSGATWSGATWSGATWSGATWSGATWSGATWSSSAWA